MGQRRERKLNKILKARELRRELTNAEQLLWRHLRSRKFFGKKFRRQHILCGFILDFYCPEDKLAIELDGLVHLKQKVYDSLRQNLIEDFGIKILRFKNKDVLANFKKVLKTIKGHLTFPSPSSMEKDIKDKVCN